MSRDGKTKPMQAQVRHLTLWEACVWAYRKQRVDLMTGRSLHDVEAAVDGEERHGRSADGVARMMAIGAVGAIIAGGGSWGGSAQCHPDAELLHDHVLALPWLNALAIMQFARAGEPPERYESRPTPHPTMAEPRVDDYERVKIDGRLVNVKIAVAERVRDARPVFDSKGLRLYVTKHEQRVPAVEAGPVTEVRYCPLEWDPPLAMIEVANSTYDRWMAALEMLADRLVGVRFKHHRIIECENALDDQSVVA